MRIYGISSGLGTDEIIEHLLALERRPLTKLEGQKERVQKQNEIWRDINTKLLSLEWGLSDLRLMRTFASKTVTSSNEDAVTATATAAADVGSFHVEVEQIATFHRVASRRYEDPTEALGLSGKFVINGQEIEVEEGSSLRDLVRQINATDDVGVRARVVDNRLILESLETGLSNQIQVTDPQGLLGSMGIWDGEEFTNVLQEAQNARVSVDGIWLERESNHLRDVVDGVTFTLQGEGTTRISLSVNHDETIEKVQAFVDKYNEVMSFLQEAQRRDEATGSIGLLFGDSAARQLQYALRNQVTNLVSGSENIKIIAQLGIEIDRDGEMRLTESKLRQALSDDPHQVYMFFASDEDTGGYIGLARRLDEFLKGYTRSGDGMIANRRDGYTKQMKDIERRTEVVERRVEMREQSLIRQFTALEKALDTMYRQSDWLNQQIQNFTAMNNAPRRR